MIVTSTCLVSLLSPRAGPPQVGPAATTQQPAAAATVATMPVHAAAQP